MPGPWASSKPNTKGLPPFGPEASAISPNTSIAETTGASLAPVTVTVTSSMLDTAPCMSVAWTWMVTARISPSARSWKSEPGSKVKVVPVIEAEPSATGTPTMA